VNQYAASHSEPLDEAYKVLGLSMPRWTDNACPATLQLISFGYGVQLCQPGLQNFSCNLTAPGGPMAITSKK